MDTIPEETTTNTPVTANVPATKPATEKHPDRVAAGKALAEFNRKAREAKKAASTSAATTTAQPVSTTNTAAPSDNQNSEESQASNNMNGIYILSIGGFIIALIGLYYKRKEVLAVIKGEEKNEITSDYQEKASDAPLPPTKIPRPQKSNIIPMA